MRILFFLEQLTVGGAEYYFVRKAQWFRRRGHRVWVASAGGPLERELEGSGIPHLTLPSVSQFVPSPRLDAVLADAGGLRDLLMRERIEVIDTLPIKPFIYAYTISRDLGVPIVLETISSIYFLPLAYRDAVLEVARAGRLYAMGEEEAVASGAQVGVDPKLFHIIPLAVDTKRFAPKLSPLRGELGVGPDATLVVSTGRLDHDKVTYLSHLLADMALLQPRYPTAHLVIIGDGAFRSKLQAEARDLGLRNVHWLGTRLDTDQLYPGADIFVGMGTAALEAAAAGLPVIIASVRACRPPFASRDNVAVYYFGHHSKRSIGHDIPGLLPSSFAKLLEPLLRDRALRGRLGTRALEVVRAEFDVDVVNTQWEAAFARAISPGVGSRSAGQLTSADFRLGAVSVAKTPPIRKVLFVNRPDAFSVPGGDTVQMVKTQEALERLGIQVDISLSLTPDARGYDLAHLFNIQIPSIQVQQIRSLKKSGVPVAVSPIFWDHSELVWAQLAIRASLSQHRDDLPALLNGLANRTLVVNGRTPHTPFPHGREFHQQQREIVQTADVLLPNSLAEARMLQHSLGIENFVFRVVPNAVDPEIFLRARPDRFFEKYGKRDFIMTAARWDDRKNLALLFIALRDLRLPLVVIGNSAANPSYTQLARAFLPEDTLIIDHLNHEELASAYAAARVHVLPSWFETPGLSSMEAASAGCSIVVGNRGSEIEYFQSEAYYCDPASINSIREAVLAAWSNYERDAPRRTRLRERIARDYTWDRAADETLAAYQMLLEKKRSVSPPHNVVLPVLEGAEKAVARSRATGPSERRDQDWARPGVSVVVVTYNSLRTIEPCLESLRVHTGPDDEVILVDNASSDATMQVVDAFVARNPGRFKVIRNERNVGYSQGVNLGLAAATMDYVVVLNPDVQVTAGWLDRMVAHFARDPDVGAVGPTTDYVAGLQKVQLYTDWTGREDPEALSSALESRNRGQWVETPLLIGFCLMIRRDVLNELGGLDPDLFLGNDDLDLSLRLREKGYKLVIATDVFVRHFGHVSFQSEPSAKGQYLVQQSTNALYEKLYRERGGVVPSGEELWGISWFKPQSGLTSIVILVHDNLELTRQCIESVYKHTHRDFELILVDNGSSEDVAAYAAELQGSNNNVKYVRNETNEGYAYGCNQGLALARGEYVVLLNNDVVVTHGWLTRLLALLSLDPAMGIVGPRTNYSAGPQRVDGVTYRDLTGLDQFAGQWFLEHAGQFSLTNRITGLCMVIRREVMERVGGLDTIFGFGNFEDDDFCLRVARAGYKIAIANDVFVHHYGSMTFRTTNLPYRQLMEENWCLFCHKWNYEGDMRQGYPAQQLIASRPFDPLWDYVPPRYEDIFHPGAAPLLLDDPRPVRFLCIPDWTNPSWREVVASYVKAFGPSDPVSLIVRVEPPQPDRVQMAWERVAELLQELGVAQDEAPDIVFEATAIPPRHRGSLYTAASAFVSCAGSRAWLYAREATACGLSVVEPSAMADFVREVCR